MKSYLQDRSRRVVIGQVIVWPPNSGYCASRLRSGADVILSVGAAHWKNHQEAWARISSLWGWPTDPVHFQLNSGSLREARQCQESCDADVKRWITANYLKMNDEKTEFLPIVPQIYPTSVGRTQSHHRPHLSGRCLYSEDLWCSSG